MEGCGLREWACEAERDMDPERELPVLVTDALLLEDAREDVETTGVLLMYCWNNWVWAAY